jgi:hypothetical protein
MISGMILLWHGGAASIPHGFALCDGNNGTPDLRDRFVIGAEGSYSPGDSGGNLLHTHDFDDAGHTHSIGQATGLIGPGPMAYDIAAVTGITSADGTTNANSEVPPYYALCYIMKL